MSISIIDGVFLAYMFIGLYMMSLLIFIYLPNRRKMFHSPPAKFEPVSIIIPCYNEASTIGKTIESILELDYPKEMIEIIVVDDRSKDNSAEIVKEYVKKYKNVTLIVNSKNSGGAAEPTNLGIKHAKYDYIAVTDADSSPEPDALKKMIGFLQRDQKVGAVTASVLVKKPTKFIQHMQAIEYVAISFARKLLDFIDAVYVTPGPFALYRKKALLEVGLFDTKNLTQDIEIVWRMVSHGYKARMCLSAKVYSESPTKFKAWWKQRVRWSIGGTQCIIKYKNTVFRKGMLGLFIVPFFTLSLFLGVIGLSIFFYLLLKRALYYYLSTSYSVYAHSTILTLQDLTFTPSILNFIGATLFFLGLGFSILMISVIKEKEVRNKNFIRILMYQIFYLMVYPFVLISALYKLMRGKYSW